MEKREHDIFMDIVANPTMSYNQLLDVGVNANNTSIQDKEVYKNNEWVQSKFVDSNGQFDEPAFNKTHQLAQEYFNYLMLDDADNTLEKQITYHRDNIFAPKEQRRQGPEFKEIQIANPYKTTSSVIQLGKISSPNLSIDELAQQNRVLLNPDTAGANLENAQWGDAPNDNFFGYFTDALVLAQYDTDGTHKDPITGETVQHKKGDLKLDNEGNFYYEKLNGRDPYGRRVLNKMNVLTTDGSFWNRYDFFDSDDVEQKSVGGSILKNLALVGPMFIPTVGPWVAGLSVATQLVGLIGTLGKMLIGSDSPTFNNMEGWSQSVGRQGNVTEYAQQHPWSYENLINLAGDVAGQLAEQRFIFEGIPKLFTGQNIFTKSGQEALRAKLVAENEKRLQTTFKNLVNKDGEIVTARAIKARENYLNAQSLADDGLLDVINKYKNIGANVSKGYMTAITVADTYGEAKAAGASDIEATLLTLGYAAAEYALLSTGLGEWIMPELRIGRYKAKKIFDTLTNGSFNELSQAADKEAKKTLTKKLFGIGKDIARGEYSLGVKTAGSVAARGLGEAVEESTEELLADFSKGAFNTWQWLTGDDTRMNSFGYNSQTKEFNTSELIDRYGLSFVGGFFGGSAFNVMQSYKGLKGIGNMTSEQAIQELVYMARNKELSRFEKDLNKVQLASTQLKINSDGTIGAGTKTDNLDIYAKKLINDKLNFIEQVVNQDNGSLSDESVLDMRTLKDIRLQALKTSLTANRDLQELNNIMSSMVRIQSDIANLEASVKDTNNDGKVSDKEARSEGENQTAKQDLENKKKELKIIQKQLADFKSGKRTLQFLSTALFEKSPLLSGLFTTPTFPQYIETKYGKKYSEVSDIDKEISRKEFKNWQETDAKDRYAILSDIFLDTVINNSKFLKDLIHKYNTPSEQVLNTNNIISHLYEVFEDKDIAYGKALNNDAYLTLVSNLFRSINDTSFDNQVEHIRKLYPEVETEEEKKQRAIDISKATLNMADNLLADKVDTFIQPYIDQGFIGTEVKNQLLNLLNKAISNVSGKLESSFGNETKQLSDRVTQLVQLKQKLNKLGNTPVEEAVNQISISIGQEPMSVTSILEKANEVYNSVPTDTSKFAISPDMEVELNNALNVLNLFKGVILAARVDSLDLTNPYGYNKLLNELSNTIEDAEKYDLIEIDSVTADKLLVDIDSNISKIAHLLRVVSINNNQKLTKNDRIADNANVILYGKVRNLIQIPELEKWKNYDEFKAAIYGLTNLSNLLINPNYDAQDGLTEEVIKMEDAIYDFFQNNQDKLDNIDELVKFINPSNFNIYTDDPDLLDTQTKDLSGLHLLWYIASRAAIKSSDFYSIYKTIIDPTASKPIAPIYGQEQAVYTNYANIVNGNIFDKFYQAIRKSIKSDWQQKTAEQRAEILRNLGKDQASITVYSQDKYVDQIFSIVDVPRYKNIVFTEGIAGAGKTKAVAKLVIQLLNKYHSGTLQNVFIAHGTGSAEALKTDLELGSAKTFTREELLNELGSNWKDFERDEKGNYIVPKSAYVVTNEGEFKTAYKLKETSSPASLIIIDEVTAFSAFDLDLIDNYARKYGITVVVLGDYDQSGIVGKFNLNALESFNIEPSRSNFISTPKLGISMRTDNSVKTNNNTKFQVYMQNPKGELELDYYTTEEGIFGDDLVTYGYDSTDPQQSKEGSMYTIQEEIDTMVSTLKQGQKIGYIYDDETSPVYKYLSDNYKNVIDFRKGNSAQGLESQYYIVDITPTSDIKSFLRSTYTGMTRATQGSLLILPDWYEGMVFKSRPVSKMISQEIPKKVLSNYAAKRKKLLDNVNGKVPEYQARTKEDITTLPKPKLQEAVVPQEVENTTIPDPPKESRQPQQPKNIPETAQLPKEELQEKYGKPIDGFEVNFDGNKVQCALDLLPFTVKQGEQSGVNQFINYKEHNIALLNTGTLRLPIIYNNGRWEILLAINGENIISSVLPPPLSLDSVPTPTNEVPIVESLPEDITSNFAKLPEGVTVLDSWIYDNIMNISQILTNTESPVDLDLLQPIEEPEVELPSVDIGLQNDETLKENLSEASETDPKDIPQVGRQGGTLDLLFYTFNTFETGVDVNNNGNIIVDEFTKSRIDSINGLMKIKQGLSYNDYIRIIARLRRAIFDKSDNSELAQLVSNILGIKDCSIRFAYKCSPLVSDNKKNEGQRYFDLRPSPLSKAWDQTVLYNRSNDSKSAYNKLKTISLLVATSQGKYVLELPIFDISSIVTLLQVSQDGNYICGEASQVFIETAQRYNIHTAIQRVIEQFSNNPEYQDVVNMCKIYDFSDRGVFYFNEDWNPNKDLINNGPIFTTEKGQLQLIEGLDYASEVSEDEWLTIEKFKEDPQCRVTQIYMARESNSGVDAGYPFVLIYYGNKYQSDPEIIEQYERQLEDPSLPKEISRIYVLPPKISNEQFVENPHEYSNLFTAYRVLDKLINDQEFSQKLQEKYSNLYTLLVDSITRLRNAQSAQEKANILVEKIATGTYAGSKKPIRLAYIFENIINNFYKGINSFNREIIENQDDKQLLIDAMQRVGINGIFCNSSIPQDTTPIGGYYLVTQDNYKVHNLPYRIHGKVDSPVFSGNISEILEQIAQSLEVRDINGRKVTMLKSDNDTIDYISRIAVTPTKPTAQQSQQNIRLQNKIKDISSKLGQDISKYYQNQNEAEVDKIIVDIANQMPNTIAFTFNNEVVIITNNKISGQNTISNLDISNTIAFNLTNISNGVQTNYQAEYNPQTKQLTLTKADSQLNGIDDVFNSLIELKTDLERAFTTPRTGTVNNPSIKELLKVESVDQLQLLYNDQTFIFGQGNYNINANRIKKMIGDDAGNRVIDLLEKLDNVKQNTTCPINIVIQL